MKEKFDWNTLNLEQQISYLKYKYKYQRSGEVKCIKNLIKFYDKNKGKT